MRYFKLYKQLDSFDCGPTVLKMVFNYYGSKQNIDVIRDHCYVDSQGANIYDLSKAAEKFGFKTLIASVSIDTLIRHIPLPAIVHYKKGHFVVIYKTTKKHIWVADPSDGKLKLSKKDFISKWCIDGTEDGIVLVIEYTPGVLKHKNTNRKNSYINIYKFIYEMVKPYKMFFYLLISSLVIMSLLQLLLPFLAQAIFDKGIRFGDINFIKLILIAQLVVVGSSLITEVLRSWLFLNIGIRINLRIISNFLMKLNQLPITFFERRQIGDIMTRIDDNKRFQSFITGTVLKTAISVFILFSFGLVLYIYNFTIFLIFLIGSLIYLGWILLFQNIRKRLDVKLFESRSKARSQIIEMVESNLEIKLQNMEQRKRWEWEETQIEIFKQHEKNLLIENYQSSGSDFINEIKNILISFTAASGVVTGEISLGQMIAIQYIAGQLNVPIKDISRFIISSVIIKLSLQRILQIFSEPDEPTNQGVSILPQTKNITLNIKKFWYNRTSVAPVLNNLYMKIEEGKTTAIVGASGSGKTSILKLILKLYEINSGKITVDGIDLNNIDTSWWRDQCSSVLQESNIFSASILDNINTSNDILDKDLLVKSVKLANIKKYIESLPQSYNTIIGKNGLGLSQGQKQRILLARAFYKNSPILILDEATNALDANNESSIIEKLRSEFSNKTIIIVAHRLSTILNADMIYVVNKGKVIEWGNHSYLFNKEGAYKDLIIKQLGYKANNEE